MNHIVSAFASFEDLRRNGDMGEPLAGQFESEKLRLGIPDSWEEQRKLFLAE